MGPGIAISCLMWAFAAFSVRGADSSKPRAKFSKRWDLIGPFIRGNFEQDGDPLEFYGGIKNLTPGVSGPFHSEVAQGGYVDWQTVEMRKNGQVAMPYPNTNFEFNAHTMKSEAITNNQNWAVGKLKTSHDGTYLIYCPGLHTLEVGGRLLRGSIHLDTGFPVKLEKGEHAVYIKFSGQNQQGFQCRVQASLANFKLMIPEQTPHIHDGEILVPPIIAPRIMNMGEDWVHTEDLEFQISDLRAHSDLQAEVRVEDAQPHLPPVLAPGILLQMPLRLQIIASAKKKGSGFPDAECVHFILKLRRRSTGEHLTASDKINIRCRQKQQSFLVTFLDRDGSVSSFAAIEPRCGIGKAPDCPKPPFSLALTLSGVSVGPLNQADSYKVGDGHGGFLFGYEKSWLIAPERSGPHNWEDWGFVTAMRAIDVLSEALQNTSRAVDADRVFIAGHSRGGHGAWNIALRIPDRALGVSPAGGWTYRQYGGVSWNEDFVHDMQNSYIDPTLMAILKRCMIEGDAELMASNLKGIDVLVRQGSEDQTVAPFLNRRMARNAFEAGANVQVSEIPGQGHWWWDTKKPNDGGVVNDATMRAFAKKHLKGKHPPLPEHFRISVINPSSFSGRAGIRILQTEVPFRLSYVDVYRKPGNAWDLHTINVRRFSFAPKILVESLSIDNWMLPTQPSHGLHFCRIDGSPRRWEVCSNILDYERTERGPNTWGPARQVSLGRFAIVAHVDSDDAEFAQAVHDASLYISHGHHMAVNSLASILRPQDISDDIQRTHNLIHIGSPWALQRGVSSVSRARWPVGVEAGANQRSQKTPDRCLASSRLGACKQVEGQIDSIFTVGPCSFSGARHGLVFTTPRWEDSQGDGGRAFVDLVVTGTDSQGLLDIVTFHHATLARSPFGNMAPDYFVSGPQYKAKGFAGFVAAGFWGAQWEWRADSAYMEC